MLRYMTLAVLILFMASLPIKMVLALDDQPEIPGGHSRVLLQHLTISHAWDAIAPEPVSRLEPSPARPAPGDETETTGPTNMPATEETYRRQPTSTSSSRSRRSR